MTLRRLEAVVRGVARLGAWLGGAMMTLAAFVIAAEVVLRKVFLVSLGGADEMASYALALGTVWALSFALIERAHIRVDALHVVLPRRVAAVLDVVALLAVLGFAVILAWYAAGVLVTSWRFDSTANTPLGTPLWIPQGAWALGLVLFAATAFFLLLRALHALITGDFAEVAKIAGARTVKEELDEASAAAPRRKGENFPDANGAGGD